MALAPSLARWEGVQKTDRIGQMPWGGGGGGALLQRWSPPGGSVLGTGWLQEQSPNRRRRRSQYRDSLIQQAPDGFHQLK